MELLVGALVVFGLLAILVRFLPRDAAGNVRLPRVIDRSIGMWVLRRLTRRRVWERPRDEADPAGHRPPAHPASAATVDGRPAGPALVSPTRHVVSGADRSSAPGGPPPVTPVLVPPARRRRNQAHRRGIAGLVPGLRATAALAAVVVVAFVALGLVLQPRGTADGEVLGATGTPGRTTRPAGSAVTAVLPSAGGSGPTIRPSTGASGAPSTATPATATPTRRPTATPRATPAPTPRSAPTPNATPRPSPPSIPSPTPIPPPLAIVECAPPLLLSVECDASGSARAITYAFDFGDDSPIEVGEASMRSHVYLHAGSYIVTVTVADAEGRTDSDSTVVTIE